MAGPVPVTRSTPLFESTARNLQAAATREKVAHLVVVSIVGVDRMGGFGYYGAKVTQERLHLDGPVDTTVVRATQFHEFPGQVLRRSTFGPVAVVPALRVQTVAARSVATALLNAVASGPFRGRLPDVAGPGPARSFPALAKAVLERTGRRSSVLAVPVPGAIGRAVRTGALLPAADGLLVGPTFEEWLAPTGRRPPEPSVSPGGQPARTFAARLAGSSAKWSKLAENVPCPPAMPRRSVV